MTAPMTTGTPEMEPVEESVHSTAPETQTADEFWDAADLTPDAAEAQPPEPVDSGQPRGPDGKFLPKSPEVPEGSPTTEAAPSAIQPPATPEVPSAADVFRYRAMGQTHAADGILANADGSLVVKPEAVGQLREAFNALHLAKGQFQPALEAKEAKIRELSAAVEQKSLAESKHEAALDALTRALQEPDEGKFLEQVYALRGDLPNLLAKAEASYWRELASKPAQPVAEPQHPQDPTPTLPSPEEAYRETVDTVEHFKLQHEFRDLTPEDWKQLDASLQRTPLAFLRPATAEEAQQYPGVIAGQLVLDTDQLHAHVTALATQARTQRETAQRTATLAAETARRTTPQVNAPPTAGGSKAPPKGERRIQSKQDMEDYWDSPEV